MRKLLGLIVLTLAVLLTGCGDTGSGSGSNDGKPTVTIWWAQWAPAEGLQQLGHEFEKETGIAVKVQQIPWGSYQDKVFLEFGNQTTEFDIVVGDSQWIGRGATQNLYVDLTDWLYAGAVEMSSVHPGAAKYLCEYPAGSGRFYAAPCETDAVGFAYRRDWFEDPAEQAAFRERFGRSLTPPQTWDEFYEVARFFHRPEQKRYGCALLTGRAYDSLTMGFQQIMWAFGGSWGEHGSYRVRGHLNTPATVQAIEFTRKLIELSPPGGSNFAYDKTLEAFTNGSTAMAMDYFAFFPGIVKQMGDKVGFFAVPEKEGQRVVSLGGQGMSISTKVSPEQQQLAKKFIAWFLQQSVQEKWIQQDAGFTANINILMSDAFRQATPYNEAFAQSLDYVQDFWNVPQYNELLAAAQQQIGAALDGAKPAHAALRELAIEHERIFKEAQLLQPRSVEEQEKLDELEAEFEAQAAASAGS